MSDNPSREFEDLALQEEARIERKRQKNRKLIAVKLEKKRRDTPPSARKGKADLVFPYINAASTDNIPSVTTKRDNEDHLPGPLLPVIAPEENLTSDKAARLKTKEGHEEHVLVEKEVQEEHRKETKAESAALEEKKTHSMGTISLAKRFGRFWKRNIGQKKQKPADVLVALKVENEVYLDVKVGEGSDINKGDITINHGTKDAEDLDILKSIVNEIITTIELQAPLNDSEANRRPQTSCFSNRILPKAHKADVLTKTQSRRSTKTSSWECSNMTQLTFKPLEEEQKIDDFENRIAMECEKIKLAVMEIMEFFKDIQSK